MEQEYLQSKWFTLVSRLLRVTRGPFSLKLSALSIASCPHPKEYIARGANQYGRWVRCSLCQVKLKFDPYSESNPKSQAKKPVRMTMLQDEDQISKNKELAGYVKETLKTPKNPEFVTRQEMKSLMNEQSQQISSHLAQTLGPILQGQQMMQQQMLMALQSQASGSQASASQMPIQPHLHHDMSENDSWDDVMGNPNEWEVHQGH